MKLTIREKAIILRAIVSSREGNLKRLDTGRAAGEDVSEIDYYIVSIDRLTEKLLGSKNEE